VVRIADGTILDSYGIWDCISESIRESMICEPRKYLPLIYDWFKPGGPEEKLRMTHLDKFPKSWCEDHFADNVIPITDTAELLRLYRLDYSDPVVHGWVYQENP